MNGHSNQDGDYLIDDDGAEWWRQQDNEAQRYQEELKAIHDRLELDKQQAQSHKENDHDHATDL